MGAFIDNCHVHDKTVDQVQDELSRIINSDAYIVQSGEKWVTVYLGKSDSLPEAAQKLSLALSTGVLAAMVHDDDVLFYNLFENGSLSDEYNSTPEYFGGEFDEDDSEADVDDTKYNGSPEVLVRYAVPGTTAAMVEEVLESAKSELFKSRGLVKLCKLLGIDPGCGRTTMRYILSGDLVPDKTLITVVPQ